MSLMAIATTGTIKGDRCRFKALLCLFLIFICRERNKEKEKKEEQRLDGLRIKLSYATYR